MFTADYIYSRIKARPFVPVRITTSDGGSLDIFHPELVMVGRRYLDVGSASAEDPRFFDDVARIANSDITTIEDLPGSLPSRCNGEH